MGVGELKLTAGEPSSTMALDGTFDYAPADWKPEVKYSVEGTEGALYVEPAGLRSTIPNFGQRPEHLDREDRTGRADEPVAEARRGRERRRPARRRRDQSWRRITGVGEAKIDLSGERTHDLTARIEAGVGEVTISVPTDVGVRIIGSGDGLGDFTAEGFTRDGSAGVDSGRGRPRERGVVG